MAGATRGARTGSCSLRVSGQDRHGRVGRMRCPSFQTGRQLSVFCPPGHLLPVCLSALPGPPWQALPSLDPEKPLFLTAFYILNQKDFIRKEHTITYPRGSACLDTEGTRPTWGRMWPLDKPSLSSNVGATVEFGDLSWCHLGKQGTSKD